MKTQKILNKVFNKKTIIIPVVMGLLNLAAMPVLASIKIEAAYVLYGQSSDLSLLPMARVILAGTGQTCPQLTKVGAGDQANVSMSIRINPDELNFPVTVCEAIYPFSTQMQVESSDIMLPKINKNIVNISIFGDTGCKSSHQDCQLNSSNWPFPSLVAKAAEATSKPDVILHMGDYNYSGTPGNIAIKGLTNKVQVYDAGDNTTQGLCQIPGAYYGQNSIGSEFPDSWKHWQSDFFSAAQPLFSQAPWAFVRGNHELCSRAGPGWFYFLDASSPLLGKYHSQLSCPAAENPNPEVLSPPYLLSFSSLNLAVIDSTNACDYGLLNSDSYINQFSILQNLIKSADNNKPTWLQMHRPLWGVDGGSCGNNSSAQYCYVNQTMQNAIKHSPLAKSVDLIVSGHMHRFQLVDFKSKKRPDQLVIGNSGVKLSGLHPKTTKVLKIDNKKATVMGLKQFGYMNISLSGNKSWVGELLNPNLAEPVLLQCDSKKYPMCKKTKNLAN